MNDRLWTLLPAHHRRRDVEQGQPLRALLGIVEEQLDLVEEDVRALYRNWFVETCEDQILPYLADLVGVQGIRDVDTAGVTLRSYVANTIRYRRRKGTLAVIEALANDVTGWKARAVEFFRRTDTTQHLAHVRAEAFRTPDLRDPSPLGLVDGPFGTEAHTLEVRRIDTGRGRYNVGNIGVFLWRLDVFRVSDEAARPVSGAPAGFAWYRFDPSSRDVPLFGPGRTEHELTYLAHEIDVPGPLRSLALADGVRGVPDPDAPDAPWFGEQPVLAVWADGVRVPTADLRFFHPWRRDDPAVNEWDRIVPPEGTVAVDPERGRLVFNLGSATPPSLVTVLYHRAFPARVGAGPYDRDDEVNDLVDRTPDFQIGVASTIPAEPGVVVGTLGAAVAEWNAFAAAATEPCLGVICCMDGRTYEEDVDIVIPPSCRLIVVAADWPLEDDPLFVSPVRRKGTVVADARRPHIRGTIRVTATATDPDLRGALVLDGLQIEGDVVVGPGDLGRLDLSHVTVVPDAGGLVVEPPSGATATTGNTGLAVSLDACVCGPIALAETVPELILSGSAVAGVDAPGAATSAVACTVLGPLNAGSLEASDAIFAGAVTVRRRQTGCVRFSYVTPGSSTPRRFRCQPDLALTQAPADQAAHLLATVVPSFTSTAWGHPAWAQLASHVPPEIAAGAEDGSEMGVWRDVQQPRREANLRAALDQYLRVGLDAGLFYVT